MISSSPDPFVRAKRSLRWYPAQWRARYGDEFLELLAAEIAERPWCLHRSIDVAAGGAMARLADAGLFGVGINRSDQPRRSLVTSGCSIAVFLTFAMSIVSHLDIADGWSAPATPATHAAILLMTISLYGCAVLAATAAAPILWFAAGAAWRRRTARLGRPALVFVAGAAVLIAGSVHYGGGWGGSGAHWAHQRSGLAGPMAFMWASTLAVSSYWAHPSMMAGFPLSEIAWMILSPLALIATVTAAARIVRRLDMPAPLLRYSIGAARVMIAALGIFVFGMLLWLVDGGPGPDRLFQAGTVDQVGLAVMMATLAVSALSVHRAARTPLLTFG